VHHSARPLIQLINPPTLTKADGIDPCTFSRVIKFVLENGISANNEPERKCFDALCQQVAFEQNYLSADFLAIRRFGHPPTRLFRTVRSVLTYCKHHLISHYIGPLKAEFVWKYEG
jgi:hypothetical protein